MEVLSHTFVGWLVLVALIHQRGKTLKTFSEKRLSNGEVVDIRLWEVQRDIEVRNHSSSCKWGPRALMTTPMERATLE
jgi:hypothetical protein